MFHFACQGPETKNKLMESDVPSHTQEVRSERKETHF